MNRLLRNILVLLLAALLLAGTAAGEGELRPYSEEDGYTYVTFGRYFQSMDGGVPDDGEITWSWRKIYRDWEVATRKELKLKTHDPIDPPDPGPLDPDPILWRVLSVDEEKVYLMSEYILFASPVHPSMKEYRETGKDFGTTALSVKLNGEFAEAAFTQEELAALLPFGTLGKVFLPSAEDLKNRDMGFNSKKPNTRKAWATEYAIRVTGAIVYRIAVGNHTPYWLRDQADSDARHCRATKQDGAVGHLHCDAADVGARPVVFLSAGGYIIAGGSGTKEDPYQLTAAP